MAATETKTKKRRARRVGEQRRYTLPEKSKDFKPEHWKFIEMRIACKTNVEIAAAVGKDKSTISTWWAHEPFRDWIVSHWERQAHNAASLVGYLKMKALFELGRRLDSPDKMEDKDLISALRVLKEESSVGTSIDLDISLGGLSLRELKDRARADCEETEAIAALVDPKGCFGQELASFARPGAVCPSDNPEAGSV